MSGDDGVGVLGAAAALRWSRPDLTAAIADHVLEIARSDGDDAAWLQAAGWAVHARSATGDGRECASDILDGLAGRGSHLLEHPAADRLRVELAVLAAGAGRSSTARTLLTPVTVADTAPELKADALCALARCAMQDRPPSVPGLIRRVEATWALVGGRGGAVGSAVASLVAAAAERRAGRGTAAVEHAAAGLVCLDRARGHRSDSPSLHVEAGLVAEWISGLLETGRFVEARERCSPLEPRLRETAHPSRQLALLHLTVARAVAGTDTEAAAGALEQAARDAAGSDVPDLQSVCWSTLAALQEKSDRTGSALESMTLGLDARQRDARRGTRFRAALDAVVPPAYDDAGHSVAEGAPAGDSGHRHAESRNGADNGRRERGGAPTTAGPHGRERHGPLRPPVQDGPATAGGPWNDWSAAIARDRSAWNGSGDGWGPEPVETPADAPSHGRAGNGRGRFGRSVPATGNAADLGSRPVGPPDSGPTTSLPEPGENGTGRRRATTAAGSDGNGVSPDSALRHGDGGGRAPEEQPGSPTGSDNPWKGWTDESPIGRFLVESRQRADDREQRGRQEVLQDPLPVVGIEPDPLAPPEPAPPHRAANPWSTGSWSAVGWSRARRSAGWVPADATPHRGAGGGRRRRAEPDDRAAEAVVPEPHLDDLPADPGTDSGSWRKDATAELDRAWSEPPAPAQGRSGADGCVVVIDLARDGRRFAGRRAGAVVRAVADQLSGRIPSGGRMRHDDADALSIVLPGWSRSRSTEWMHRTLPGVFELVVTADALPGTRLRAAVHDVDGPVGAQLLHRLDVGAAATADTDRPGNAPLREERPAASRGDGRHGRSSGTPFRADAAGPPPAGGRRRKREQDTPAAAEPAPVDAADSTDGLGLADLLAGALAAYRSI